MAKTESTSSRRREFRPLGVSRTTSPRLWIQVTQDIIDKAVPKDSQHCMIADAVKATFPEAQSVVVDLQTIRFSDPARGLRYIYLTPRIAQEGLIEFDEGRTPPPFECRLHRAVQIVSMFRRDNSSGKMVRVRKLGKKRVQLEDGGKGTPTVIGGATPPVAGHHYPASKKKIESASGTASGSSMVATSAAEQGRRLRGRPRKRREFGLRAFKIGSLLTGQA